jgi:glucose/arabinose dehydrogenase
MKTQRLLFVVFALAPFPATLAAQVTNDPFPQPIGAGTAPIVVAYREFATVPGTGQAAPRLMHLLDEPGTRRLFVSDQVGPIHTVSYDGRVAQYVDTNDQRWGFGIQSQGRERGLQSFAFHPQFAQQGTPGYGKFYTWVDIVDTAPTPDFRPRGSEDSHDMVLLEWTARTPTAATYDGGPPEQLIRMQHPFGNHNGGQIAFNPNATPGSPDYGLLYMGVADGGSGGDPQNMAQDLSFAFGKIFRIDPLGTNSSNGRYGIPADNPWASDNNPNTLGEIYAYGVRNPQRFAWDPRNGNLFLADIGQNTVEELTLVPRGGNLGWNTWEGSFTYAGREGVNTTNQRAGRGITFPVVEYGQPDPLLQSQSAATGVHVHRASTIPQLSNMVIFGDLPSGEVFAVSADNLPNGGQAAIRRVLFRNGGAQRTLLQLIQAKNQTQGRQAASRVDVKVSGGPDGRVFLLNKGDGVVREIVAN